MSSSFAFRSSSLLKLSSKALGSGASGACTRSMSAFASVAPWTVAGERDGAEKEDERVAVSRKETTSRVPVMALYFVGMVSSMVTSSGTTIAGTLPAGLTVLPLSVAMLQSE